MLKKIISFALCLLVAVGTFVGCGGKADTSKKVTLKWIFPQDEQKDAEEVEKLVNEKLAKLLPNTTIDFVWDGALESTWSMMMASKTEIDLAWTGYTFDMMSEYRNGSYTELTDLVEKYAPNIKKEMSNFKDAYNSGKIDGKIYAIPNQQPILHQSNWLGISKDFYKYFPVDEFLTECHNNPKTTEKVYQIYEQYLLKLTDAGLIKPGECSIDVTNFFLPLASRGYDWIVSEKSGAWLCYDAHAQQPKIVSFMQTDEYKTFIKYAARWFDMGYISKDYLATGQPSGVEIGSGNTSGMWFCADEDRGVQYRKDNEGNITSYYLLLDAVDNMYVGATRFGSEKTYTVIPYTSKNPERAMMLMDLLRSKEGNELLNLICYGEEGKHYTKKEDPDGKDYCVYGNGWVEQPYSNNDYGIPYWRVSSSYLTWRTPNILQGQKEYAEKWVKNASKDLYNTKLYGFMPDDSNLVYNISQVKTAINEYHKTLICGAMTEDGYEKEYNQFMKKMQDAGINEILEELQKQVDDYINK